MQRLLRLRRSFGVLAVMALAACGAAQNVSPDVGAGSNSGLGPTRILSNHGGRFRAAYVGSFSRSGDCSGTAMFAYKGDGNAKFLHSSGEQMKLTWYCGTQNVTGSVTLTRDQVPRDSITASVSSTDFKSPCYDFTMSFTVTGGTGRFRNASGGGTIILHRLASQCLSYTYSDKWRGTLTF